MPVQQDQFQVTPYTSTVPTVQIPPDAIEAGSRPAAPLQGNVLGKGTGALAIGDSLLKGFMLGHQQKVERHNAEAQTAIGAADAAAESAYQKYQDTLRQNGGQENDASKAAYDQYKNYYQVGTETRAKYAIPDKTQKGKKTAAGAGASTGTTGSGGKDKKPPSAGFNNIKDFFEANPHIVPQVALLLRSGQIKPQGLSPQGQEQVQNLESQKISNQTAQQNAAVAKQRQDDLNFVALHQSFTPEQIQGLPAEEQKQLAASKFRIEQEGPAKAKFTTWQSVDGGQFLVLPDGEQPPPGYSPWEKTTAGTGLGSKDWALRTAAKSWGIPVNQLTPADQNYLDAMSTYAKKRAALTASASGSSTNVQGDRESWIRQQIGPPPAPPSGRSAIDAATFQQGIQPPPAASGQTPATSGGIGRPPTSQAAPTGQKTQGMTPPPQAAKTAKAGMAPPPGGKQTALKARVTRQAVTAQQNGYQKAEDDWAKEMRQAEVDYNTGIKNGIDPTVAKQALTDAQGRITAKREAAKARVATAYDAAVKSIGGTPGNQQPIAIQAPDGYTYTFPDQKSADAFKQAAGIQ